MTYVIYHTSDSRIFTHPRTGTDSYISLGAARGALTRLHNSGRLDKFRGYGIAEYEFYKEHLEQTETVINLMSGKEVVQSVNTPRCCDPSSELYWSM